MNDLIKAALLRKLAKNLTSDFQLEFRPELGTIGVDKKVKGTLGTMGGSYSKIRTSTRKVRSDKGRKKLKKLY